MQAINPSALVKTELGCASKQCLEDPFVVVSVLEAESHGEAEIGLESTKIVVSTCGL